MQDKIFKVVKIIETYVRIPTTYLKEITRTDGLFEARIRLGVEYLESLLFFQSRKTGNSAEWFYQEDTKTPKKEIDKAVKLMNAYYENKSK